MKVWSSHFAPPGRGSAETPPILVPDGFAPTGLLFGWLSLARPRFTLVTTLCLLATVGCLLAARLFPIGLVLLPPLHLAIAAFGNDWRRWELRRAGFVDGPISVGRDRDSALLHMLSTHPALLARAHGGTVSGTMPGVVP